MFGMQLIRSSAMQGVTFSVRMDQVGMLLQFEGQRAQEAHSGSKLGARDQAARTFCPAVWRATLNG